MSGRDELEHAAELIGRLTPQATPGPWRDSTVDGNRYAALVSDTCTRSCNQRQDRYPNPPEWMSHPHEGYGGCLIAESQTSSDRRLMAVLRNVADHLPDLLEGVSHEDVAAVGLAARRIAQAVIDTHTPTSWGGTP